MRNHGMIYKVIGLVILGTVSNLLVAQTTKEQIRTLVPQGNEVYRHGYSELDAAGKAYYDQVLNYLLAFDANNASPYYFHRCDLPCVPNGKDIQLVMRDLDRMQKDMPELYILSSTIPRYDYTEYVYYARIGYINTPESYLNELQGLKTAYEECSTAMSLSMSEYEKVKTLHDAYCLRTTYGDMMGADASNVRGSLINKKAVCEGIARGWLYLCQQAGIKCIYISGQLTSQGNHAWNYTQVDGQWYLMDVTADCALVSYPKTVGYEGFLRGKEYQDDHYLLTNTDGGDPNCDGVYQAIPALATKDYDPSEISTDNPSVWLDMESTKYIKDGELMLVRDGIAYDIYGHRR